ncbi:MAG: hypothetical protein KZQ73_02950 [Candidatus Thiodiazotropha sp. (ex Semelilucina semeliformis)]|nr:hypothetical protein [Candidatus Thiodiazotropha sp. (ex Semelilucina semeliformis)]
MTELSIFLVLVTVFIATSRVSVWAIGIDRAAHKYPADKEFIKTGCWSVLYANGGTKDRWIQMLIWRFSVIEGNLRMNISPQYPLVWFFPSLSIPIASLYELKDRDSVYQGGWRRCFEVEGAGLRIRVPSCVANEIIREKNA